MGRLGSSWFSPGSIPRVGAVSGACFLKILHGIGVAPGMRGLISMCFGLGINVRRTDSSSVDIGDDKFNTQSLISESFVDEFLISFLFLDNLAFNIIFCLANLYTNLDNLSGLLGWFSGFRSLGLFSLGLFL